MISQVRDSDGEFISVVIFRITLPTAASSGNLKFWGQSLSHCEFQVASETEKSLTEDPSSCNAHDVAIPELKISTNSL